MFRSISPARRRTLVWFSLTVVALVLLASGINELSFQPGKIFARNLATVTAETAAAVNPIGGSEILITLMRGALAIMLLLLPISLISALMTKEGRRRLLMNLVLVVCLLFLADRIQKSEKLQTAQTNPGTAAGSPQIAGESGETLPPMPGAPSEGFVLITSVVVVMAGVGLAVWLGRGLLFPRKTPPLEEIAREAERARSDLAEGMLVEDVVIRCYRQMSLVAKESRKLNRSQSMTPHEFEETLAKAGLPKDPVRALTRIFEDVRYGGLVPGPVERQQAIDCLSAIAASCRVEKN